MTADSDPRGLLQDLSKVARSCDTVGINQEIIGNRLHGDTSQPISFLYALFKLKRMEDTVDYFILGSTQHRTKESIDKENTPFIYKHKDINNTTATLGTRGYGANLRPFHHGGSSSIICQIENTSIFPENLNKWGSYSWRNFKDLNDKIRDNQDFYPDSYRPAPHFPVTADIDYNPFFTDPQFANTELCAFIKEKNFKFFYITTNPDNISRFDEFIQTLGKIYENNKVSIFSSKNFKMPTLIKPIEPSQLSLFNPKNPEHFLGFGLDSRYWTGSFTLEWKMGVKPKEESRYWNSMCRFTNSRTNEQIYSQLDSNGSDDVKFGLRTKSIKDEDIPTNFSPDIRVTVAVCNNDYINALEKTKEKAIIHQNRVFMFIEGDLINHNPNDFGLNQDMRHLPEPKRMRVFIEILNEKMKDISDSGLKVLHIKNTSSISEKSAIHQMISKTLKLANKYFKNIGELDGALDKPDNFYTIDIMKQVRVSLEDDKKHCERSRKRKKEALNWESRIAEYITDEFSQVQFNDTEYTIDWMDNDAKISSKYDLNGEGIDILGIFSINEKNIWICIQCKDQERSVSGADKFIDTKNELNAKNSTDIFLSFLILGKKKSFEPGLVMKMLKNNIITVLEDDKNNIGYNINEILLNQIESSLILMPVHATLPNNP